LQLEQLSNKDHMLVPIGKTTGVCIAIFLVVNTVFIVQPAPHFLTG